jgi:uncharacterized protein
MRVVVDTNVVVSRYLSASGPPARMLAAWEHGTFDLLVFEPILAEHERVLLYDRLMPLHHMTPEEVSTVVSDFRRLAIPVAPTRTLTVVAVDPSDNRFLECAEEGGADFVVSGDRHLLDVSEYRGIQILSPSTFLLLLPEPDS